MMFRKRNRAHKKPAGAGFGVEEGGAPAPGGTVVVRASAPAP